MGVSGEYIKKRKLMSKIFFLIMMKFFADVKHKEIKRLVAVSRNFFRPFQERHAIARARIHTRAKVFRRAINCTRK